MSLRKPPMPARLRNLSMSPAFVQFSHSVSVMTFLAFRIRFSALAQDLVDYPTTANMAVRFTTMVQNFVVAAARLVQRVGQDRHDVKALVVVNGLRELHYRAVAP